MYCFSLVRCHIRLIAPVTLKPSLRYSTANTQTLRFLRRNHVKGVVLSRPVIPLPVQRCAIHTTPKREAGLPVILIALWKPIAKFVAVVMGRGIRQWWGTLPTHQKGTVWDHFRRNKYRYFTGIGTFTAAFGVFYVSNLRETPITKRKRFLPFTNYQYHKIVEYEYSTILQTYDGKFLPVTHPAYSRVLRVANRLVKSNGDIKEMSDKQWTVAVVQDETVNAFVLPTGHIFVLTGLLDKVGASDEQLGFILGHEMAHSLLSHGAETVLQDYFLQAVVIVFMCFLWALMPNDGIAQVSDWFSNKIVDIFLEKPRSRMLEEEADFVGMHLAAKACFDVRESSMFFEMVHLTKKIKDEEELPVYLSTHPADDARASNLNSLVPQFLQLRDQCGCARLQTADPRQQLAPLRSLVEEKERKRARTT